MKENGRGLILSTIPAAVILQTYKEIDPTLFVLAEV
jgi:hypothetical protein